MDGDLFVELGKILARKHKEMRGRFARLAVLKELYPRPAAYADNDVFDAEVERRVSELLEDPAALDRAMKRRSVITRLIAKRGEGDKRNKEAAIEMAVSKPHPDELRRGSGSPGGMRTSRRASKTDAG